MSEETAAAQAGSPRGTGGAIGSQISVDGLAAPVRAEEDAYRRSERRGLLIGLLMLGLLVAGAAFAASSLIDQRSRALLADMAERQSILLDGRMELAQGWLDDLSATAGRVSDSQLFQLFVTEAAMERGQIDGQRAIPANPLAGDHEYMERLLSDFVSTQPFQTAYVIAPDGRLLLRSADAPRLERPRPELFEAVRAEPWAVGALRAGDSGLTFDLVLPIQPVQQQAAGEPLGALVLSVPASGRLADLQAPQRAAAEGERLRLIQQGPEAIDAVDASASRLVARPDWPLDGAVLDFQERPAVLDEAAAYSQARSLPGTPWWLVQERPAAGVAAELRAIALEIGGGSLLIVSALLLAAVAAWLGLSREHKRRMAKQYSALAERIESQRSLLQSINDAVADGIALKDEEGRYRYVNPAFARMVERPETRILGKDDADLFGFDTARRLAVGDPEIQDAGDAGPDGETAGGAAKTSGSSPSPSPNLVRERVFIHGQQRHWRLTKAPYRDGEGRGGLVAVVHDVSDLVTAQERRERTMQQCVSALVRAVELRDPYLAGHSRRVARLAASVCGEMGGSAEDIATVEMAGNLSQLGKLWVPRELLVKPDRLSEEELKEIETHMAHAAKVLGEIDFDLPVSQTLMEMHERLDGTGYPKGLEGAEISRLGRILGVCDVFCARIAPRSYRGPIPADKALAILAENAERYDPEVVATLARVVERHDLD